MLEFSAVTAGGPRSIKCEALLFDLDGTLVDSSRCVDSTWRRLAENRLDRASLPRPKVLITADECARSKPDPLGYRMAVEALGVSAAACLVLEDAPVGVAAGRDAGMAVVGVTTACDPARLEADFHIDDLSSVSVRLLD
ncbi:MAG: HAD-IA family hydrolase [Stackebrandtia sp.]